MSLPQVFGTVVRRSINCKVLYNASLIYLHCSCVFEIFLHVPRFEQNPDVQSSEKISKTRIYCDRQTNSGKNGKKV